MWNLHAFVSGSGVRQRLGAVYNSDPTRGHTSYVMGVAALPDGRSVTVSQDFTAIVWGADGTLQRRLGVVRYFPIWGHTSYVTGVTALPDGRLVSVSDDRTAIVWGGGAKGKVNSGWCVIS
jgi:WD40 repeat protein